VNQFDLGLYQGSPEPTIRKRSSFEYIASLGLPAMAIIATLVSGGNHPKILLALVVAVFLSVGVVFYPSITVLVRTWRARKRAERLAREAFPDLRRFVRRFADFVDGRQNNTLHYMVQNDLCQGDGAILNKLALPDMGIWSGFRDFFANRMEQEAPTLSNLRRGMEEFHHLVGTYNNQCVTAIFERLPRELKADMPPRAKSNLNSLQQRFSSFLSDYQDFAKDLSESARALKDIPQYFALPKPF
jgi:hypothetical protein